MKNRDILSSRRIACVCAAMLALAIMPAEAENGDQAPPRDKTPSYELDSSFFDFNKTLNGIMKPGVDAPVKPSKKPDIEQPQKSTTTAVKAADNTQDELPPKPSKKPKITQSEVQKSVTLKTDFEDQDHSKLMSREDTELYQKIFALQKEGKIDDANKLIRKLDDDRLYGYVLQQRYLHPTAYSSKFSELTEWLEKYADLPGAHRIYDLAERKRPAGNNTRLPEPDTKIRINRRAEPTMIIAKRYASSLNRSNEEAQAVRGLQKTLAQKIRSGELQSARNNLENTQILDTVEHDILAARLASAYLYRGELATAYNIASKAAERSGLHVPLASWVAGLVSWKRGKYTESARFFENVGRSNYASGWTRSGGAYWAARAHMRRGDVKSVSTWLQRAASNPRTFYGLIATRALGENFDFNWHMPTFTKDNHKVLSSDPRGARAIALVKIGEISKAQAELLRVDLSSDPKMHEALLAFAGYAHLPGLAMRLGSTPADKAEGIFHDAAIYPLGPWKPQNGYKLNPSLINAIMRRESRFNPDAESPSGAMGLMQLMPATARSVSDGNDPQMDDPEVNLELGQRYLRKLMKSPNVDNNLLSLLIAYNAGPGNLKKWKSQWSKVKDPLLFIELLPSAETRAYVEHVLANYWIYRMRANKETPTLDAVVAGMPVKFASLSQAAL